MPWEMRVTKLTIETMLLEFGVKRWRVFERPGMLYVLVGSKLTWPIKAALRDVVPAGVYVHVDRLKWFQARFIKRKWKKELYR
jgi:hypothetical protein